MNKNTRKTANVGGNSLTDSITSYNDLLDYVKRASSFKRKATLAFKKEVQQYLEAGTKWDVIISPGAERWRGEKRTMNNDVYNWYNATINDMSLSFSFDRRTHEPIAIVTIHASGDNVGGDCVVRLPELRIYPAYSSNEGMEYKKGYGKPSKSTMVKKSAHK